LLHGSHDGYKRLSNAVIHERTVFLENGTRILLKDIFRGKVAIISSSTITFHPRCGRGNIDDWVTTHMGGVKTFIQLIEGGRLEVMRGREEPIHGWYSPAYGIKLRAPC